MADSKNSRERVIDGLKCTVILLHPEDSFELQVDLFPAVGAALGAWRGLRAAMGRGDITEATSLGEAVGTFSKVMPRDRLRAVKRQLLAYATIDGQPLYDAKTDKESTTLLLGKTMTAWKLLLFAVEVNYPDFFVLLAESMKASATAEGSKELTTSQ